MQAVTEYKPTTIPPYAKAINLSLLKYQLKIIKALNLIGCKQTYTYTYLSRRIYSFCVPSIYPTFLLHIYTILYCYSGNGFKIERTHKLYKSSQVGRYVPILI